MSAVLEAGAAPAGSYRAKYQRPMITVNALVGAFSPGAYLMLGVGESPFVLGGGVSFTPELRSLETENATGDPVKEKVSTVRVGGFLAVDVSILSL